MGRVMDAEVGRWGGGEVRKGSGAKRVGDGGYEGRRGQGMGTYSVRRLTCSTRALTLCLLAC